MPPRKKPESEDSPAPNLAADKGQPAPEVSAEAPPPANDEEDSGESVAVSRLDAYAGDIADELDSSIDLRHASAEVRDAMLELFRHRPKAWDQMREDEQRDVSHLIERAVDSFLAVAVRQLAADDRPSIEAVLAKFNSKGGEFQVTLKANGGPDMAADLARLDGHEVLIISADAERYKRPRPAAIRPDQAPLEFSEPEPGAPAQAASPFDTVEEQNELVPNREEGTMELTNRDSGAILSSRPMTDEERARAEVEPDGEPIEEPGEGSGE